MRPNFLILGPMKCGTTSLYHYLRQHPDVYMSPVKEPQYYWREGWATNADCVTTAAAYENLFDGVSRESAVGEASTHTFHSLSAVERIRNDLPGARLVALLRNPARRAYSHHLHLMRLARERRQPDDALQPGSEAFEMSFYAEALERWQRRFPPDQLRVLLYEEFAADPQRTMRELFTFLGVEPAMPVDTSRVHNAAATPRSHLLTATAWKIVHAARRVLPLSLQNRGLGLRLANATLRQAEPMSGDLYRRLIDAYRTDIAATEPLLGRDLSVWLR